MGIVIPDATQSALADFDQNDDINVFDGITLLQIIVGSFPPGSVVCRAPPMAPIIDLLAASDTGASDADDVTNDSTPTLSVTANAGVLVRLFVDAALMEQATTSASGRRVYDGRPGRWHSHLHRRGGRSRDDHAR